MRWIRPRLALVACGWLVLHVCLLVSIPTALCPPAASAAVSAECTCEHGDGQVCPMHHTRSKAAAGQGSDSCACSSTSDPLAEMTAALLGPACVLVPSTVVVARAAIVTTLPAFHPDPLDVSFVPDSPPPRG